MPAAPDRPNVVILMSDQHPTCRTFVGKLHPVLRVAVSGLLPFHFLRRIG
jgi:hypothetical protein